MSITTKITLFLILTVASTTVAHAQTPELEKRLHPRITQEQVIQASVRQVRKDVLRNWGKSSMPTPVSESLVPAKAIKINFP
jgi:hypothetical protein